VGRTSLPANGLVNRDLRGAVVPFGMKWSFIDFVVLIIGTVGFVLIFDGYLFGLFLVVIAVLAAIELIRRG
jgi:hypothetical protein